MSAPKKSVFLLMPEAAGAGAPFLRRSLRPVRITVALPHRSRLLSAPTGVRLEDLLRAAAAAAPPAPACSSAPSSAAPLASP